MKSIRFLLLGTLVFLPSFVFGEGTRFIHKDTAIQQEFENVYQAIGRMIAKSSATTTYLPKYGGQMTGPIKLSNGSASAPSLTFSDNDNGIFYPGPANKMSFSVAGSTVMVFNPGGEITNPIQPAFNVVNSVDDLNVTGDATTAKVEFDLEIKDKGGDFDNTNDQFVAPITGMYQLNVIVFVTGFAGAHTQAIVELVTSNRSYRSTQGITAATWASAAVPLSVLADMDAGDTAYVNVIVSGGTKVVDILSDDANYSYTSFSGFLAN